MSMGTGVMHPNPLMLGTGAPPHSRTTFALPHPTFHMLGFPPAPPVAPFVPLNIAPSLPLVPPSISLSLSSSRNSNPTHHKRDRRTKYSWRTNSVFTPILPQSNAATAHTNHGPDKGFTLSGTTDQVHLKRHSVLLNNSKQRRSKWNHSYFLQKS